MRRYLAWTVLSTAGVLTGCAAPFFTGEQDRCDTEADCLNGYTCNADKRCVRIAMDACKDANCPKGCMDRTGVYTSNGEAVEGAGSCGGETCGVGCRCGMEQSGKAQCICNSALPSEGYSCVPELDCGSINCAAPCVCSDRVHGVCACDVVNGSSSGGFSSSHGPYTSTSYTTGGTSTSYTTGWSHNSSNYWETSSGYWHGSSGYPYNSSSYFWGASSGCDWCSSTSFYPASGYSWGGSSGYWHGSSGWSDSSSYYWGGSSGYWYGSSGYQPASSYYYGGSSGYWYGSSGYHPASSYDYGGSSGYWYGSSGYHPASSYYYGGSSGYWYGSSGYQPASSHYYGGSSGYWYGSSGYYWGSSSNDWGTSSGCYWCGSSGWSDNSSYYWGGSSGDWYGSSGYQPASSNDWGTSSGSWNGSSGYNADGCDGNSMAEAAKPFALGTVTMGKACFNTSSGYYFWRLRGGPWHTTDKFTVHVKIMDSPDPYMAGTLSFGLGSTGTWQQAVYATNPTWLPSGSIQESTMVDVEPIEFDGAGDLYLIVTTSLYQDKSIAFEFTVTQQP